MGGVITGQGRREGRGCNGSGRGCARLRTRLQRTRRRCRGPCCSRSRGCCRCTWTAASHRTRRRWPAGILARKWSRVVRAAAAARSPVAAALARGATHPNEDRQARQAKDERHGRDATAHDCRQDGEQRIALDGPDNSLGVAAAEDARDRDTDAGQHEHGEVQRAERDRRRRHGDVAGVVLVPTADHDERNAEAQHLRAAPHDRPHGHGGPCRELLCGRRHVAGAPRTKDWRMRSARIDFDSAPSEARRCRCGAVRASQRIQTGARHAVASDK